MGLIVAKQNTFELGSEVIAEIEESAPSKEILMLLNPLLGVLAKCKMAPYETPLLVSRIEKLRKACDVTLEVQGAKGQIQRDLAARRSH